MAHFARLDDNSVVVTVIVVSNEDMTDENGNEVESLGIAVCEEVVGPGPWVQTSYNNNWRRKFAAVGDVYSAEKNVFYAPTHEYASWVLDEDLTWQPPIPKPEGKFVWNEEAKTWRDYSGDSE